MSVNFPRASCAIRYTSSERGGICRDLGFERGGIVYYAISIWRKNHRIVSKAASRGNLRPDLQEFSFPIPSISWQSPQSLYHNTLKTKNMALNLLYNFFVLKKWALDCKNLFFKAISKAASHGKLRPDLQEFSFPNLSTIVCHIVIQRKILCIIEYYCCISKAASRGKLRPDLQTLHYSMPFQFGGKIIE